jgi:MerR family mercuric resistance operon transcriptional regulator
MKPTTWLRETSGLTDDFLSVEKKCLDSVLRYGVYNWIMSSIQSDQMTIGTLAKSAGVGVETIRFYQRKGLIHEPARRAGFRKYSDADVKRIRFIKRVQELGFSLKDAQELLGLQLCNEETSPRLAEACQDKIVEIERKITDLKQMIGMLRKFSQTCGNHGPRQTQCSLLDCFENNWECCDTSREGE